MSSCRIEAKCHETGIKFGIKRSLSPVSNGDELCVSLSCNLTCLGLSVLVSEEDMIWPASHNYSEDCMSLVQ